MVLVLPITVFSCNIWEPVVEVHFFFVCLDGVRLFLSVVISVIYIFEV